MNFRNEMKRISVCFIILFFALSVNAFFSDEVHITSENLIINDNDFTATFEGNVLVTFEDMMLLTKKIIVYYSNEGKNRSIKKILMPTKIKAIKNSNKDVIIADNAEFDYTKQKLVLNGNVIMQKEKDILVTDKLIYSVKLKVVKQIDHD